MHPLHPRSQNYLNAFEQSGNPTPAQAERRAIRFEAAASGDPRFARAPGIGVYPQPQAVTDLALAAVRDSVPARGPFFHRESGMAFVDLSGMPTETRQTALPGIALTQPEIQAPGLKLPGVSIGCDCPPPEKTFAQKPDGKAFDPLKLAAAIGLVVGGAALGAMAGGTRGRAKGAAVGAAAAAAGTLGGYFATTCRHKSSETEVTKV